MGLPTLAAAQGLVAGLSAAAEVAGSELMRFDRAESYIGVMVDDLVLHGVTEPYRSGSGYLITPVLGVIPPDLPLDPNPDEVEDWFEVPLDILFDPDNYARQHANFQGHDRHYYDMDWQGRRIWGVTAGIIINLARRLPAGWHR